MQDNISELINKKIDSIVKNNNIYHAGNVIKVNNFIIEATGLDDAFYFEKVYINGEDNIGYVEQITNNKIIISLIKSSGNIKIGDEVITTGEVLQTSFSEHSIGMIIDGFGLDKMTGRKINDSVVIPVESRKISIMERSDVHRPLETGIAAIDLMYPIGRGQRQLIIGDKKTGKTQICLDTIINQKGKNIICIYVAIGKTKKELKRFYANLVKSGAHAYTLIVAAFNDDTPPLIKLTPYVALSIATYYMEKGKDVLVCIDDLKKHADACREIALLSEKNTGRDAYPADIFYTHSRLLEKGCQHENGGSITILPIVETKGGDITDYISTNIISITDGQIVLSEKNFKKGQKPAINYGLSVSRLGSAVQKNSIKKIGSMVRRELLSYLETADIYQLVNQESMSDDLKAKIELGGKLLELLKQPKMSCIDEKMIIERFGFILGDKLDEELAKYNQEISDSNSVENDVNIGLNEKPMDIDNKNSNDNGSFFEKGEISRHDIISVSDEEDTVNNDNFLVKKNENLSNGDVELKESVDSEAVDGGQNDSDNLNISNASEDIDKVEQEDHQTMDDTLNDGIKEINPLEDVDNDFINDFVDNNDSLPEQVSNDASEVMEEDILESTNDVSDDSFEEKNDIIELNDNTEIEEDYQNNNDNVDDDTLVDEKISIDEELLKSLGIEEDDFNNNYSRGDI